MISIAAHLNRADADDYLDDLAHKHWISLNGVRKDGMPKRYSLT